MIYKVYVDKDEYINTDKFPLLQFKYDRFNPVQSAYLRIFNKNANKLLASTTSSGKTVIAEMSIAYAITNKKKAIYIGPLKALAQEKIDEWKSADHPFANYKLAIATGDYVLPEKREAVLKECAESDITIITPELFDSLTRRIDKMKHWFENIGVVIVDEAHLLTMPQRGSALECALMRFTTISNADLVLLSATMTNTEDVANWISTLNGKDTYLIDTDWRPCRLDIWYEPYDDFGSYDESTTTLINRVIEKIREFPSDKFIVFVHTKNIGRKLLHKLKQSGIEAEFHNAEVDFENRQRLVQMFSDKSGLRILIATSTLAWGINLPARRVIIAGMQRGTEDVSPIDIRQMIGRAGRVGFDPKGDAYIFYPRSMEDKYYGILSNPTNMLINSRLTNQDELAFHVVNEINEGVNTFKALWEWFKRSFAAYQRADRIALRYVLDDFIAWGIAKEQDGVFVLSPIGKIAAWFYYSPFMIATLNRNIRSIENTEAISIAWAIGTALPEYPVPAEIKREAYLYFRGWDVPNNKEGNCFALYLLLQGLAEYKPELVTLIRTIQADLPRLGAALQVLNKFYQYPCSIEDIIIRIQYGIPEELVPLCKIQGIGANRAKKLYVAGFRSVDDIINNPDKAAEAINSKKIVKNIIQSYYGSLFLNTSAS